MSVKFGAGEDEAIEVLGGSVVTTAGYFRTNARCALKAAGAGLQHTFKGALKSYLDGQPGGDKDFWYGFYFRGGGGFLTRQDGWFFYDDTGKPFLRCKGDNTASGLIMGTSTDGTNWTEYVGSTVAQPSTPTEMTFRIKIHPTLGTIAWYYGGALLYQIPAGNTTTMCSGSPAKWRGFAPNSNGDGYYSEWIATTADDPRVGLTLVTQPLVAIGALSQWAGPVTAVNEIVKDQTTAQSTASAANDETFTIPGTIAVGAGTEIRAIIWSGEYRTAASPAPQHVAGILRISGVVYPAALQLVDAVNGLLQFIWETDPSQAPGTLFDPTTINTLTQPGNRSAA